MIRVPITSAMIRSTGYDASSHVLEVEFLSGEVYQYLGVPPKYYEAFLHAPSKGRFFHSRIRRAFPHRLLT